MKSSIAITAGICLFTLATSILAHQIPMVITPVIHTPPISSVKAQPASASAKKATVCATTGCNGDITFSLKPMLKRSPVPVQLNLNHWQAIKIRSESYPMTSDVSGIPQFDSIQCSGAINLTLIPMGPKTAHSIHFHLNKMQALQLSVHDHTLYINEAHAPGNSVSLITLNVPVTKLVQLNVNGATSVQAKNINIQNLILKTRTSGVINFKGHMNVSSITALGTGKINLQWVNANKLTVNTAGQSKVTLSGVATHLIVKSSGASHFNGQYLRATKVLAKGSDNANITLLATNTLRAFASNNSSIYYYKVPVHFSKQSVDSGTILLLGRRS